MKSPMYRAPGNAFEDVRAAHTAPDQQPVDRRVGRDMRGTVYQYRNALSGPVVGDTDNHESTGGNAESCQIPRFNVGIPPKVMSLVDRNHLARISNLEAQIVP